MAQRLRLVIGGRGTPPTEDTRPSLTPQQSEARGLVEAWLDQPGMLSVAESIDDLVARIATLLTERDGRGAPPAASGQS